MVMNETLLVLNNRQAFYETSQAIISVRGQDAISFLNRLATNDITALGEHRSMQTSFTNNKGRMIDHCLLFAEPHDEVLLISSHEDPQILLSWLEQYHFVEDIEISDKTAEHSFRYVVGDKNTTAGMPIWQAELLHHEPLTVFGSFKPVAGRALSRDAWNSLRIMCLMPQSPNEIRDGMMPQNINLAAFIAENKGCYIGQEVIAKALTYQKHVKVLCGVAVLEGIWSRLFIGLRVKNDRGQTGEITSIAPHFVPGEVNALLLSDLTEKLAGKDEYFYLPTKFVTKTEMKTRPS
jgi:folate-binding protein YgfZ